MEKIVFSFFFGCTNHFFYSGLWLYQKPSPFHWFMVMELGEMGWLAMDLLGPSIGDIFKERKNFSKCTIKLLGRQMVECLEYLHVRDIVHCDVKSDNFAISATNPNKIVIFDFGLACAKDTNSQVFRGSLLYASIAAHRFETWSWIIGILVVWLLQSIAMEELPKIFS